MVVYLDAGLRPEVRSLGPRVMVSSNPAGYGVQAIVPGLKISFHCARFILPQVPNLREDMAATKDNNEFRKERIRQVFV